MKRTELPPDFTSISSVYRKQFVKALIAILLFIFVYISFLVLSIILLYYGWQLAIAIISVGNLYALLIGIGIVLLTIMILVFLVKFVLTRKLRTDQDEIEIDMSNQPELYKFISSTCFEVGAKPPRSITISPIPNARVYYDSGFFNLFFPARKNLEIGYPLLISMTKLELKAIVAHEFGHFAQNATKLGSYIYTVNRVIFDLVYMRDKWDQTLAKWSRTFSLFNFFAQLTFMIVSGVRFVLRKIYYLIQRINGALSREMEFHADRVAVSVTGSEPICDALLKLQILKIVHDSVSRLVDNYFDDRKIIPANVFDLYEPVAFQLSKQTFVCTSENHFPKFNESDMRKIDSLKRLKASNLWASHPQFNERKEAAYRIFVDRLNQPGNAIELIRNPNQLGRKVTKLMIRKDITKFISDSPETIAELMAIHDKQVYDARYRGFYYGRILQQFDIEASVNKPVIQIDTEEKIFNEELESGFDALRACDADINALKSFATSAESFGYFEYEGKRCDKFDIQRIDKLLGERQKKILNELAQYEQRIFQMYLKNSGEYRLKYIGEYKLYFTILGFRNAVKEELSAAMKMNKGFGKITQYTGGVEKALIERANAICSRFINLIEKMDRVVSVLDYDELHVANGLGKHLCKTLPSLQEKPFQIAKFYGLNTSIAAVNAGLNRILQIQLRAIIRIQDQIHAGASRQ